MGEKKQLIISLGREYGSGGHVIAEELAKRFGIPFYDYHLIGEIAAGKKVKRIMEREQVDRIQAEESIAHHDRKRKTYHNHFCRGKWGDSRNYDLSINSSKLGIETTIDILEDYIRKRIEK